MTRARPTRAVTGVVLWLVAAAAATTVGVTAVGAIGSDIFGPGQSPLSQSEVDELLASSTPSPQPSSQEPTPEPIPTTTSPPTTSPPGEPAASTVTSTAGGTVISRCRPDGNVQILSATPAQGYQVETDDDDDDDHPQVTFTAGDVEIEMRLRCVGGVVQAETRTDDD